MIAKKFAEARKLNWKPDLPDHRDHHFKASIVKLPRSIDLSAFSSPIEDQGSLGSCTANAFASMIELNDRRKIQVDVSRLFVYYNERVYINEVHQDNGAYIRDGIKTLVEHGWCSEATWPYVVSKFARKPPPSAYKEALKRRIKEYLRIEGIENMKACLAEGFPFTFGFSVFDSFMNVGNDGIMSMPKETENMLGGHAVLAVGYNDDMKYFKIQNSWGTDWGINGYFFMPYDFISNTSHSDDFWAIRETKGKK